MIELLDGEAPPDWLPDTRQAWMEKWLLLAAQDGRQDEDGDGSTSPADTDAIIRMLTPGR